uniref:Protein FAM98A n=1 Tax=Ciona intestinalis TaxID=7719 RepID=H2XUW3_CIOIN
MLGSSIINDILDSLYDLRYFESGISDEASLKDAAKHGASSLTFTSTVARLTNELRLIYNIEANVSEVKCKEDADTFLSELNNFLVEYGSPFSNTLLQDEEDCFALLLFLVSELQAARIYYSKKEQNHNDELEKPNHLFEVFKLICITLRLSKPPPSITLTSFIQGISKKLNELVASQTHLSQPLVGDLTTEQWKVLELLNNELKLEYESRRAMLIKRLDVTISSFNWSNTAKTNMDRITAAYQALRHKLDAESPVSLAHLIAARQDLAQVCKTSFGETRHSCPINKIVIGKVPDRGGRTNEISAPPPEMPSWQKRQDGGGRGGRGGGGRGGGGRGGGSRGSGGHHQGSRQRQNNQSSDNQASSRGFSGNGQSRWGRGRGNRPGGNQFFNQQVNAGDGFSSAHTYTN